MRAGRCLELGQHRQSADIELYARRLGHRAYLFRRAEPAHLVELDAERVHRVRLREGVGIGQRHDAFVGHHQRHARDLLPDRRHARDVLAPDRLLEVIRPMGSNLPHRAYRFGHRPALVGVDADRRVRADGLAHREGIDGMKPAGLPA